MFRCKARAVSDTCLQAILRNDAYYTYAGLAERSQAVTKDKRRMTRDISEKGCFIRKDEQVKDMVLEPVGKEISFSLDIPAVDDCIDITGTVVHH